MAKLSKRESYAKKQYTSIPELKKTAPETLKSPKKSMFAPGDFYNKASDKFKKHGTWVTASPEDKSKKKEVQKKALEKNMKFKKAYKQEATNKSVYKSGMMDGKPMDYKKMKKGIISSLD